MTNREVPMPDDCTDRDDHTDRERRLDEVLGAFLVDEAQGVAPSPTEVIARHPELAHELASLFADRRQVQGLLEPLLPPKVAAIAVSAAAQDPSKAQVTDVGPTEDAGAAAPDGDGRCQAVDPLLGSRLRYFGDYELKAVLGRGGMGVVYRAHQLSLDRPVALKLIRGGVLAGDDDLRRFQNEAEAVALLDHPGIVTVYEVGQHDGQRYFSMRLVPGTNLGDRLTAYRDDPRAAAALLAEVAEAVHHAHVRGILHRDLKPANILVDDAGRPHITDFGLAKRVEADAELTATGAVLGTPAYMAPEQALGRRGAITTATDVHGLGSVLYALLTALAPFRGDSVVDTLTKVKEQPPEPPRRLNAKVPRDLEVICLKCLEKDPQRRYPSAEALANDLRRYLAREPITARRATRWERTWRWCRRNPVVAVLETAVAGLLISVAAGASLVAVHLGHRAEHERRVADQEREARAAAIRALGQAEAAQKRETVERRKTEQERDEKTRALRRAEGLYLTSQSSALLTSNPGLALLLAVEGARRHPGPLANNALLAALDVVHERETLIGHPYEVLSIAFSSDGRRVLTTTGSGDMTARVWDAATGKSLAVLKGPRAIQSAQFSPDGWRVLTSANLDPTPRIWDVATAKEIRVLPGQLSLVLPGAFSPDGRRVVTPDNKNGARVWDAQTGKELLVLEGHKAPVHAASFSPNGHRLLTVSADQTARIWNAATGKELVTLDWLVGQFQAGARQNGRPVPEQIGSATFSPDSRRVLTTSTDYTGRIWDAETGAELITLRYGVESAQFSPDGKRVLIYSRGKQFATLSIRDAATGEEVASMKGHRDGITNANFSPDSRRVASASYDQTVRIWDVATGKEIVILRGHKDRVNTATFSPDGRQVASASDDRTARLWSLTSGREDATLLDRSGEGGELFISLSPDGRRAIIPSSHTASSIWDIGARREAISFQSPFWAPRFSIDGRRVVAVAGQVARILDGTAGKELNLLQGHEAVVNAAAFSPDSRWVVTASDDKTARIWDAEAGKQICALTGHSGRVYSAEFDPNGRRVITASDDQTARIWDAQTGQETLALKGHRDMVRAASFTADGRRAVTSSADHTARVWDAADGRQIASIPVAHWLNPAVISPDNKRLVTLRSFTDPTARLWDIETGQEVITLKGHGGPIEAANFSPDGRRVVTASEDKTARIWDAATGRELVVLKGHEGRVDSATFSRDGHRILTTSMDTTARIWDAQTGREIATLFRHEGRILSAVFDPDGRRVLAVFLRDTGSLLELANRQTTVPRKGHSWQIMSASFSPDSRRVVTASLDGTARIWDTATGEGLALLAGHEGRVLAAEFGPDGRRIVTASTDHTARIWDATSGKELAILKGHTDEVRSAIFSPDGARILTASADPTARIWDAVTGKELVVMKGHEASLNTARFSPDGRLVLTASSGWIPIHEARDDKAMIVGTRISKDHSARLWDAATGRPLAVLNHNEGISSAVFSPDSGRVATASGPSIHLWETQTGREIRMMEVHEGPFGVVRFSPDGKRILTLYPQRSIRLWDPESGKLLLILDVEGGFRSATFFPDGRRLLTLSDYGVIRTWPVDPLAVALERKPRDLTPEERAYYEIGNPE
jgi:WD40 repeat protein